MAKMLYSLTNKNGAGVYALLDRKKIPCYYLITDDAEEAEKDGWKSLQEVIREYETPAKTPKRRGRPPKVMTNEE